MPLIDIPPFLGLILFGLLFAWADRFAGGGFGWDKLAHDHGGPLRGHSAAYTALLVIPIPWIFAGYWGALFGFAWFVARLMSWRIDGHSAITPRHGELRYSFLRHSYPLIPIFICWTILAVFPSGIQTPWLFFLMWAYPVIATGLAKLQYDFYLGGDDINATVEIYRGALFGILAGIVLFNS